MPKIWRPIKVSDKTYAKIVIMKASLEQANRRPITMGDTIDTIITAACRELATNMKVDLPKDIFG